MTTLLTIAAAVTAGWYARGRRHRHQVTLLADKADYARETAETFRDAAWRESRTRMLANRWRALHLRHRVSPRPLP
jgi:hypothetical protein